MTKGETRLGIEPAWRPLGAIVVAGAMLVRASTARAQEAEAPPPEPRAPVAQAAPPQSTGAAGPVPSAPSPRSHRPGLWGAGLGVAALGAGLVVGGKIYYDAAQCGPGPYSGPNVAGIFCGLDSLGGGLMMGFGVAHLVVGVSLVLAGLPRDPPAKSVPTMVLPTVTVGSRALAMKWTF
jgi:hypothetical protein